MYFILSRFSTRFVIALMFGIALWFASTSLTYAQQPPAAIPGNVELDGYAWSSTIGWISLNCKTGGTSGGDICATSNYFVQISAATGVLSGYAWSSTIGWIRFGGLSGFPASAGTVAQNARVTGTYPNLNFEGWARACSGTNSAPGTCSSMTNSTTSGDWDGWISFRRTVAPTYGVSTNATAFNNTATSFAWGSEVVGWVNFNNAQLLFPPVSLSGSNCTTPIPNGSNTCNATISWSITSATSPNVYNVTTNTTYAGVLSGTNVSVPIRYATNTISARDGSAVLRSISLTGVCASGVYSTTSATCVAAPLPAPIITLNILQAIVRSGSTVSVQYSFSRALGAGEACTIYGPGMPGSVTTPPLSATLTSSGLKSKTRFTIICTGPFGTVTASDIVDIIPSVQEV